MKSRIYLWGSICVLAIMFTGCKAKQSAYLQVYEAAQERSMVSQTPAAPVAPASPVVETPAATTFQTEKVTPVDGQTLKQYGVVIGSFINKTNAESLKTRMQSQGYSPVLAQNEKGMYRVILATFDTRSEATSLRNSIRNQFKDAWLLERL